MGGTYSKRIGRALKACRTLGEMSQDELAQKVGLAGGAVISAYEAGDKVPTLERAIDMALHLGVSLSQLVGEQGAAQAPQHITNNANGDHQTVYMNVEGSIVLMDDLRDILRTMLREELAVGRKQLLAELREALQEDRREEDAAPPETTEDD